MEELEVGRMKSGGARGARGRKDEEWMGAGGRKDEEWVGARDS